MIGRVLLRVVVGAALLALAAGCRSAEQRELEAEVHALDRKIDGLRGAPNEQKHALLSALEATACVHEKACKLKAICVDAYRAHLAALDATAKARALLARPDGGPAASLDAARELSQADHELARSKELASSCASEQGALRREASRR